MDSNSDGGLGRAFMLLMLVLAIMIGVAACGAPIINGSGLSWDNSIWTNAQNQRTERERLRLNAETRQAIEREETARIMSDNMMLTIQWIAVGGSIVGALAIVGWTVQRSVVAWSVRPHRPQQRIEVHLSYDDAMRLARPHLAAIPDASVEWVDDVDGNPVNSWAVVSPSMRLIKPLQLTDSQHEN